MINTISDGVSVLQFNAHHAKAAMALLLVTVAECGYDLALLQEPYVNKDVIAGIPLTLKVFCSDLLPRAAVALFNKNLSCMIVHCTQDMVLLSMDLNGRKFLIGIIYCPPSGALAVYLDDISVTLSDYQGLSIIFGGDFMLKVVFGAII